MRAERRACRYAQVLLVRAVMQPVEIAGRGLESRDLRFHDEVVGGNRFEPIGSFRRIEIFVVGIFEESPAGGAAHAFPCLVLIGAGRGEAGLQDDRGCRRLARHDPLAQVERKPLGTQRPLGRTGGNGQDKSSEKTGHDGGRLQAVNHHNRDAALAAGSPSSACTSAPLRTRTKRPLGAVPRISSGDSAAAANSPHLLAQTCR